MSTPLMPWQPGYFDYQIAAAALAGPLPSTAAATTLPLPAVPALPAEKQLEQAVVKAAQEAWTAAAPALQQNITLYIKDYLSGVLVGKTTPSIPTVTIPNDIMVDGHNVTKVAAKYHGFKAFFIGLGMSALAGVTTVFGQLNGVNLLSKDGWIVTATLLIGSVISGVTAYLTRLQISPKYETQLLMTPPPNAEPCRDCQMGYKAG